MLFGGAIKMKRGQIDVNCLAELTCVIPFMDDGRQRRRNLSAVVGYLAEQGCGIVVAESGVRQCAPEFVRPDTQKCSFHFHRDGEPLFHRTRTINRAVHLVRTSLIALWDADIVIPYIQLARSALRLLERECDYAFPFDGRCVDFAGHASAGYLSNPMRQVAFATHLPQVDEDKIGGITVLMDGGKLLGRTVTKTCVGGAVLFRRDVFMQGGMENEAFVSYGPEDKERDTRFRQLGFVSYRAEGLLYHLTHPRGINSDEGHLFSASNWAEYGRISGLSPSSLATEIAEWGWTRSHTPDAEP